MKIFVPAEVDPEDREAWLLWRRSGIGASDAGALLGLSPWGSAVSVYADKTDPNPPVERTEEYLMWGHLLEDPILDEFERRTGMTVRHRQVAVENVERPYMRATPDGFAYSGNRRGVHNADGPVEVKITSQFTPWDEPPLHYQAQMAWQLAVTGMTQGWIVALFAASRMEIYPIAADPELTVDLQGVADDFWERVETGTPPPADGHSATGPALARMFPTSDPDLTVEVERGLVDAVISARAAVKEADKTKVAAENALKEEMGDAETAVALINGEQVELATWKTQSRRTVNTEALFEKAGIPDDDRDKYMKVSTSRVLRPKTIKE